MSQAQTPDILLDVAERLFAERGIERTSIRQLTAEAKANLAAVSYHFGSKEGLVRAVFERRLKPLNEERMHRLAICKAAAGEGPLPLEEVVRAFVEPVIAMRFAMPQTAHFARLVSRSLTVPSPMTEEVLEEAFAEVARCFREALARALPTAPSEALSWGFHFMVGTMAHTCTLPAALDGRNWIPTPAYTSAEGLNEWLVRFVTHGLEALSSVTDSSPVTDSEAGPR